jgi:hypothetical protein
LHAANVVFRGREKRCGTRATTRAIVKQRHTPDTTPLPPACTQTIRTRQTHHIDCLSKKYALAGVDRGSVDDTVRRAVFWCSLQNGDDFGKSRSQSIEIKRANREKNNC